MEPHQGLVGGEEGSAAVIPTDGQQGHGAKLLPGKVGGGAAAQDHWLLVIVLGEGNGWVQGCLGGSTHRPSSSPSPAPHLRFEDAGGPVPHLVLIRAGQVARRAEHSQHEGSGGGQEEKEEGQGAGVLQRGQSWADSQVRLVQ